MATQVIVLAILILVNAFFAATEIAFISINDAKIEKQAKEYEHSIEKRRPKYGTGLWSPRVLGMEPR